MRMKGRFMRVQENSMDFEIRNLTKKGYVQGLKSGFDVVPVDELLWFSVSSFVKWGE